MDKAINKMNVLVACEFSGRVREAFKAKGHNAWSCDLLDTEIPGQHYKCDIREVLYGDWDLVIAHPPCTYLTNSGVRWLYEKGTMIKDQDRWDSMFEASRFFRLFLDAPVKKIAVENPIPHKYASLPKYDQVIQPWQFGEKKMKATCLWLKNLEPLKPSEIVGPPPKEKEERNKWQDVWMESPGPERQKNRSRTYEGIAKQMAEQWG